MCSNVFWIDTGDIWSQVILSQPVRSDLLGTETLPVLGSKAYRNVLYLIQCLRKPIFSDFIIPTAHGCSTHVYTPEMSTVLVSTSCSSPAIVGCLWGIKSLNNKSKFGAFCMYDFQTFWIQIFVPRWSIQPFDQQHLCILSGRMLCKFFSICFFSRPLKMTNNESLKPSLATAVHAVNLWLQLPEPRMAIVFYPVTWTVRIDLVLE